MGPGLLNGLNGDFFSAICVLVPQIEHFVRTHLKSLGVHTLVADDRGVETEKGLGALLDEPDAAEAFGANLVFEMKTLLTDRQGPNFRNVIAHGLVDDSALVDRTSIYTWWLALYIAIFPLAAQRRAAEPDRPMPDET